MKAYKVVVTVIIKTDDDAPAPDCWDHGNLMHTIAEDELADVECVELVPLNLDTTCIGDEVLVHGKWIGLVRKIHDHTNAPDRYFVQWRHPSEPGLQNGWFDQGELEKHG